MKKVQKGKRPRRPSKNEQETLRATVELEARRFLDDFHTQARELHWQEAIPLAEEALKRVNWLFGPDHVDVGTCWQNLAWALHQAGRTQDAEECYHEALANRRSLVPMHGAEMLVQTTRSLLDMLQTESRDSDALEVLREQVPLIEKALPPEAPEQAEFQLNIAVLILKTKGNPAEALKWLDRALPLLRRLNGHQVSVALEALGAAHARLGQMDAARSALQEYAHAVAGEHGGKSREFANALSNCGERFREAGALEDALAWFQRSVAAMQAAEGASVEDITGALRLVAGLAFELGHGEEARNQFLKAARMRESAFGPNSPLLAEAIADLGAVMYDLGDPQALNALGRALDIWNAASLEQRDEARYWGCVNTVILGMNRIGSYAGAMVLAQQCRDRALERKDLAGAASALAHMASAHAGLGDDAEAERCYREALQFVATDEGAGSRSVFDIRCTLASFLGRRGRFSECLTLVDDARRDYARVVRAALAAGSERQRLDVCTSQQHTLNVLLSLAFVAKPGDTTAIATAHRHVCSGKGRAFEAFSSLREHLRDGKGVSGETRTLATLRGAFAAAVLGSSTEAAHQAAALGKQIEELERVIAPLTPAAALEQRLADVTPADLAAAIPEGCAIVEFVNFDVFDFAQRDWARDAGNARRARYAAFVVRAGAPESLAAVDLGDAHEIHSLIITFRKAVSEKVDSSGEGTALRQRVFDPLRGALGPVCRIMLVPDGELAKLPFAALPDEHGHLIDEWSISYLATARDLIRLGARSDATATAPMVFADPDFDLRPSLLERLMGKERTRLASSRQARILPFQRLSETFKEGKRIGTLLGAAPLLGRDAAESRLQGMRGPRVLHIASHGFFVDPDPVAGDDADAARQTARVQLSAMARSGLAFAGANRTLAGERPSSDGDDGIVTALELADLNLEGTELVVLSACDTGLGDIRSGEGVLGLRRAFALAGARTIVMSLWRVPDEATRQLMEHFYTALKAGAGRVEAMREAQTAMKRKRPRVRDWAAFITEGDPGTLALQSR
jgi:CHAT domain-containing protein/tetratricopeptide (TPR) repeat protein